MSEHRDTVRLLIAARNRGRAQYVASRFRMQSGEWRPLSYENHQAFPDARLYVDRTWSDHPNAAALQALIARRITQSLGKTGGTLGQGSRAAIARTGE